MSEYLFVLVAFALFMFAEFNQECRMTRIAQNKFISYGEFFRRTLRNGPYRWSYILIGSSFLLLLGLIAFGLRMEEQPVYYIGVAILLISAVFARVIALRRFWRRNAS